jgi:uncharacterized membrane protein YjgN (DUF898 family)
MDQPLAGQAAASPSAPAGPRVLRPVFTGTAHEYFRIWIVNLFFSLVTLGIYSAWAKVRKKKYFYGSTTLDGDSFDYLASPKAILKGRLIAAVAFLIYAFASQLYPAAHLVLIIVGLCGLPWLMTRALAFNARNSAWRGLRFDFTADAKATYRFFLPRWIGVGLSLGFAYPWYAARQREFIMSHHAYGVTGLHCPLSVKKFYGIYVRAALLSMLLGILAAGSSFGIMKGVEATLPQSAAATWVVFLPLILGYAGYGMIYAYVQARAGNLMWNTATAGGMRFESSLAALELGWLYVGNVVAAAVSVGLLIPWGVVRTLRYRLEHFSVIVEDEMVYEANPALARIDATGQELGDFFNVDFGL